MDRPQSHRLKPLLDEIQLQLGKVALEPPETGNDNSGIIDIHNSDVDRHYHDSLRKLASNIEHNIAASIPRSFSAKVTYTGLSDTSLIWKVPAFCGDLGVIDQDFVKSRIEALQRHRSAADQYTDDIWNTREIISWEESEQSSVILVEGTSQTLRRLQTFGVLMVNHLRKTQQVLHLLSPLPTTASVEENEVLRQLAVQCLQKLSDSEVPEAIELIASTTSRFQSGLDEDYLSVIEQSLCRLQIPVSIIFNTEILRPCRGASPWPTIFQNLCAKVGEAVPIRLNVMIISGRKLNSALDEKQIPVVRVLSCPNVPITHAHGMGKNSTSRPDRTPLSILSRNVLSREDKYEKIFQSNQIIPTSHFDEAVTVHFAKEDSPTPCVQVTNTTETGHTMNNLASDEHFPVHDTQRDTLLTTQHELDDPTKSEDDFRLGGFQDADSNSLNGSSGSWFRLLKSRTHEMMYGRTSYDPNSYKHVKVAVLDTGFAYTENKDKQALKPYRQRIAKFANFVDDGMGDSAAKQDPPGHGTAVAIQVCKVSRDALLYICRVSKREPDNTWSPEKYAVEKAIRKASTPEDQGGWGVDIINMSFGWQYDDHPGLRDAIQFARKNGVHMLAPTSNDGLLGPHNDISYPSIAQEVISIDAADGLGGNTMFSPSSQSVYGGNKRFSAPGLDLESPHSDRKWSGSSFACAVATGVCALVLEFVRQPPLRNSPSMQKAIKHMSAMTDILRLMSKAKGPEKLEFLLPWLVLGNLEESRFDTSFVIVRELRKRYGPELGNEPWRQQYG